MKSFGSNLTDTVRPLATQANRDSSCVFQSSLIVRFVRLTLPAQGRGPKTETLAFTESPNQDRVPCRGLVRHLCSPILLSAWSRRSPPDGRRSTSNGQSVPTQPEPETSIIWSSGPTHFSS